MNQAQTNENSTRHLHTRIDDISDDHYMDEENSIVIESNEKISPLSKKSKEKKKK